MSWSVSFPKPVPKEQALFEINKLGPLLPDTCLADLEAKDQLDAAKDCARLMLKSVPGPLIMVRLSGHANGVGWQKKEGWANNFIQVTVTQVTEDELRHY